MEKGTSGQPWRQPDVPFSCFVLPLMRLAAVLQGTARLFTRVLPDAAASEDDDQQDVEYQNSASAGPHAAYSAYRTATYAANTANIISHL